MTNNDVPAVPKPKARKRPFGVTMIVILQMITISILILIIITLLAEAGLLNIQLPDSIVSNALPPGDPHPKLIVMTVILIYAVTVAWGLWTLKRWAWFLLMIQIGFDMTQGLWSYFQGEPAYFKMLTNIIYVLYLNMREVQQAFGHEPTHREAPWTT
ncbi:MAG: hypothetical protein KDJ52_22340 [Anaerolineae bacterium]|nr:hypothetical protein [Anaerolineae bacterium]